MVAWPEELPPPALNSLQESPPNNALRSQMDKGPAKVRRRTTANVRRLAFVLKLIPAEVDILDDFYTEDTLSGTEAFDYEHPRTGETVSARFVDPPSYQEQEGTIYVAQVSLEILP